MKKLFTLFVALCCMAGIANAKFADGVKIYVQGTEVAAQEQGCFSTDLIQKGHMSYDPTRHILYVVDVVVQGSYGNALEIDPPADADFTVTVMLCGSSGSSFYGDGTYNWGMYITGPVEIRGYGLSLKCEGKRGGIYLSENASLTINGGVQVIANGTAYGVRGAGTDKYPMLKIVRGALQAYSTNTNSSSTDYACISKVNLVREESTITSPDGAVYDASKNGSVVKSGNYITNNTVKITPDGKLLYVYPRRNASVYDDLTGIVGTFTIKKGEETQPNPCLHADGDVFNVSLVEGPDFKQWDVSKLWNIPPTGYEIAKETKTGAEITATTAMSNGYGRMQCFKKVDLKRKMYVLNVESSAKLQETTIFDENPELENFLPSAVDKATKITYANNGVNGEGYIYYTTEESSKAGIYRIAWADLQTNKDKATVSPVRDPKNDYYPFAGLSYNIADGELYGIVKKTSDSKWYLVTIQVGTGGISVKGALSAVSASNPPIAMTCDRNGDIYCMVYQKDDPLLYKVNPSNGAMTKYSHPGFDYDLVYESDITTANMYKFHSMVFDVETNKLYWKAYLTYKKYYVFEIDLTVGHADLVTTMGVMYETKANVGMFQELPRMYTVTATTKEGI